MSGIEEIVPTSQYTRMTSRGLNSEYLARDEDGPYKNESFATKELFDYALTRYRAFGVKAYPAKKDHKGEAGNSRAWYITVRLAV